MRREHARNPRRRGMTFPELVIGLAMTTMVLGALGAVWYGIGHAWAQNGSAQSGALTGSQAAARVESVLRQAKYICQCTLTSTAASNVAGSGGSNAVFFWAGDNWNGVADGCVQVGELALIEHDAAASRIYLYQAKKTADMDPGQIARAGGVATWSDLCSPLTPGIFKNYDFVQRTVLGEAVQSAAFNTPSATPRARPMVEYTLTVSRPGSNVSLYGSVALRGPTTRPL